MQKLNVTLAVLGSLFAPALAGAEGPVVRDHRAPAHGRGTVVVRPAPRPAPAPNRPAPGRPVVVDHRNYGNGRGRGRVIVVRPRPPGHTVRPRPRPSGPPVVIVARPPIVNGRPVGPAYGRDRRIVVACPAVGNQDDEFLAQLFVRHINDLSCENIGDLLRRLSNEILSAGLLPDEPTEQERIINQHDPEERLRMLRLRYLKYMMNRPRFIHAVLSKLTTAFQSCDRQCFDDGQAIGVLSGAGYCNGSIETGGLGDDEGFRYQQALPVCQTANYIGCETGYAQAVDNIEGCAEFASGEFTSTYNHWVSQDCHID